MAKVIVMPTPKPYIAKVSQVERDNIAAFVRSSRSRQFANLAK